MNFDGIDLLICLLLFENNFLLNGYIYNAYNRLKKFNFSNHIIIIGI